jgi:hypothetical protein
MSKMKICETCEIVYADASILGFPVFNDCPLCDANLHVAKLEREIAELEDRRVN